METTTYATTSQPLTLVEPVATRPDNRDDSMRLPRGQEGKGFMEAVLVICSLMALVFFLVPGLPAWAGGVFLVAPAGKAVHLIQQAMQADFQVDNRNDLLRHIERELPD